MWGDARNRLLLRFSFSLLRYAMWWNSVGMARALCRTQRAHTDVGHRWWLAGTNRNGTASEERHRTDPAQCALHILHTSPVCDDSLLGHAATRSHEWLEAFVWSAVRFQLEKRSHIQRWIDKEKCNVDERTNARSGAVCCVRGFFFRLSTLLHLVSRPFFAHWIMYRACGAYTRRGSIHSAKHLIMRIWEWKKHDSICTNNPAFPTSARSLTLSLYSSSQPNIENHEFVATLLASLNKFPFTLHSFHKYNNICLSFSWSLK